MKQVYLVFVLLLIFSCKKSDDPIEVDPPPAPNVPTCIAEIIDDPVLSEHLRTVRVQELDNELHYWLNTDFVEVDGSEFIVSENCDTLCLFCGFCLPPDCAGDYDVDSWTTIWEE